jgi:sugar lactone lactonase YvrE
MEIGLAAGAGSVWFVTSGGTNGVVAIDPASGKRRPTIPLGRRVDTSQEIYVGAVGMRALWVLHVGSTLYRIDPGSRGVVARIGATFDDRLALGAGSVWLMSNVDNKVRRLAPSGRQTAAINVPSPTRITYGAGAVWVLAGGGSDVVRIDPATNRIVATTRVSPAQDIAAGPAGVWVADKNSLRVSRISTDGKRVESVVPIPQGATPLALAEAGGRLWMTSGGCSCRRKGTSPMVFAVDPATNAIVTALHTPMVVSDIAVGEGAVWAADNGGGVLFKIAYR